MATSSLFANDSVNELNEMCRDLHSALLLAESYHPKPIRRDADGELRFWTALLICTDCSMIVCRTFSEHTVILCGRGIVTGPKHC